MIGFFRKVLRIKSLEKRVETLERDHTELKEDHDVLQDQINLILRLMKEDFQKIREGMDYQNKLIYQIIAKIDQTRPIC